MSEVLRRLHRGPDGGATMQVLVHQRGLIPFPSRGRRNLLVEVMVWTRRLGRFFTHERDWGEGERLR